MTDTEKKIIPELFEIASQLSTESQRELVKLGRMVLIIEGAKNGVE